MKEQSLIGLLHNNALNTFHPIMYWESPLPGGQEANKDLIRYKSKGHHTSGFKSRDEALESIQNDLKARLEGIGFEVNIEVENDIEWNGEGIPADVQLRSRN